MATKERAPTADRSQAPDEEPEWRGGTQGPPRRFEDPSDRGWDRGGDGQRGGDVGNQNAGRLEEQGDVRRPAERSGKAGLEEEE